VCRHALEKFRDRPLEIWEGLERERYWEPFPERVDHEGQVCRD